MIAARNLRVAADVEELYGLGVASGLFPASEINRLHVYAQAVTDVHHAKIPGAIFRENVAYRRWYATLDAEDEARLLMQSLERDELLIEQGRGSDSEPEPSREDAREKLLAWAAGRS